MSSRPPIQPLIDRVPIINPDGTPTQYFIRYLQERGFDIDGRVTPAQVAQMIADWSGSRFINTNFPLAGGGSLNADLTLEHEPSGVAAGVYGDATHVPQFNVDEDGHITGVMEVPISGGGGGGGMTLIGSVAGTGLSNTLSLASIPATYTHLQARVVGRSTAAGTSAVVANMRFNGDTGANYEYARWNRFGTSGGGGQTSISFGSVAASGQAASRADSALIDIFNYADVTYARSVQANSTVRDAATATFPQVVAGAWLNTANPINQVDLILASGNWTTDSTLWVYGI